MASVPAPTAVAVAAAGVVRGEPVQGVAQVRLGRDQPPDQQGDAEADQGAGASGELQPGGHQLAACRAAAPMNRGSGVPVAIAPHPHQRRHVQRRAGATSRTCPSGVP